MVTDILKAIVHQPIFSKKNLAHQFHTSEPMIEQVLSDLKRMGCIQEEDTSNLCGKGCASCKGCPMASSTTSNTIISFRVTEKGKRVINQKNFC